MTSRIPETFTSPWPGDPGSAWAEAVRSPEPYDRLPGRPDVDPEGAASIADWIEDQRSLLPMFAFVFAGVGAVLVGGLLFGILPLSGSDRTKESVQWIGGTGLLIAAAALWAWEVARKRMQRERASQDAPPIPTVVCELSTTTFHIHDGDGYGETCIAIDADASNAQAARLRTAFRIWLARLEADPEAASAARNEQWRPSGANAFAAQEIFGPQAAGGYIVRRPLPPADGWGLLIAPRKPAKVAGQLRFADVLRWKNDGWGH